MATWDLAYEAIPAGTDSPTAGDDNMRDMKLEGRQRLDQEHVWLNTASTGETIHREGSARVYFDNTEPTLRPDGVTSLDVNDDGRIWIDKDNDNLLKVWDGTALAFEDVTVSPPGDMTVGGDLGVSGDINVTNSVDITDALTVDGALTFNNDVTSGSQSIAALASWTPTKGVYNILTSDASIKLKIRVGGTWYESDESVNGLVIFDGTYTQLYNKNAANAYTVYYHKFNNLVCG